MSTSAGTTGICPRRSARTEGAGRRPQLEGVSGREGVQGPQLEPDGSGAAESVEERSGHARGLEPQALEIRRASNAEENLVADRLRALAQQLKANTTLEDEEIKQQIALLASYGRTGSEIEKIIRKQEEIGLKLATDGEFRRSWWHFDFFGMLDGVEIYELDHGIQFQGVQTKPRSIKITGKIGFSNHPMLEHFKFLKAHTKVMPKMTIPSPSSLHFRYGRDAVPESELLLDNRQEGSGDEPGNNVHEEHPGEEGEEDHRDRSDGTHRGRRVPGAAGAGVGH